MTGFKFTCFVFVAVFLVNSGLAFGAAIDPYKGRWKVDMGRTLENFRQNAREHVPPGGFPDGLLKSMQAMSLDIRSRRFIFRQGKRRIINSRFKVIARLKEGVVIRIKAKKKSREQFIGLLPEGYLRVFALIKGQLDPRASANHYFWKRVVRKKRSTSTPKKKKK